MPFKEVVNYMDEPSGKNENVLSVISHLLHSPVRIHSYTKYSASPHILESIYIVQRKERLHEKLPKIIIINFHYHTTKSKIWISPSWNLSGSAWNMDLSPSQPTNLHLNPLERIEECHLQRELKPLPGPKDTRWPHAASLLSPHVLLDSRRFKSASKFPILSSFRAGLWGQAGSTTRISTKLNCGGVKPGSTGQK